MILDYDNDIPHVLLLHLFFRQSHTHKSFEKLKYERTIKIFIIAKNNNNKPRISYTNALQRKQERKKESKKQEARQKTTGKITNSIHAIKKQGHEDHEMTKRRQIVLQSFDFNLSTQRYL